MITSLKKIIYTVLLAFLVSNCNNDEGQNMKVNDLPEVIEYIFDQKIYSIKLKGFSIETKSLEKIKAKEFLELFEIEERDRSGAKWVYLFDVTVKMKDGHLFRFDGYSTDAGQVSIKYNSKYWLLSLTSSKKINAFLQQGIEK